MEKFIQKLEKAEKEIQTATHLIYISFSLLQDKNILLSIITKTKQAITNCINAVLQYEYLYKKIKLYKEPWANFKTFKEKCAVRYNITSSEIKLIEEIFKIVKAHEEISMKFLKGEKIIILANDRHLAITIQKTKEFLQLGKKVLEKIKDKILF